MARRGAEIGCGHVPHQQSDTASLLASRRADIQIKRVVRVARRYFSVVPTCTPEATLWRTVTPT